MKPLVVCLALILSVASPGADALHNHNHHQAFHNRYHIHARQNQTANGTTNGRPASETAQDLVSKAHAVLRDFNGQILRNPHSIRYRRPDKAEAQALTQPAPLLRLDSSNATLSIMNITRRALNATTGDASTYTVPNEVAKAAKTVARIAISESGPGELELADKLRLQWQGKHNDTVAPEQAIQVDNGLWSFAITGSDGATAPNTTDGGSGETMAKRQTSSPSFWLETITQRGKAPFASNGYKVWRNVLDYGAKGDGTTDDTEAFNRAILDGERCRTAKCAGVTTRPATVYVPSGTYLISSPIIHLPYTELLGNPLARPIIVGSSSFVGLGVITSSAFTTRNAEWYIGGASTGSSAYRNIRNLVIDIRGVPQDASMAGIHWQASHASSVESVDVYMADGTRHAETTHVGIYVENGIGGFLGDLVFGVTYSGIIASGAKIAIGVLGTETLSSTLQDVVVSGCQVGISVVPGTGEGITSLSITDMRLHDTAIGIAVNEAQLRSRLNGIMLYNCGLDNVEHFVRDSATGRDILAGGAGSGRLEIDRYDIGHVVDGHDLSAFAQAPTESSAAPVRNTSLVSLRAMGSGLPQVRLYTRRRPSYGDLGGFQMMDAREHGAHGDGETRDDLVLNAILRTAANLSAVVYLPYGIYRLEDTLDVPIGTRLIGQAWPQLMAVGSNFNNATATRPAVRVGQPGEQGIVEMQGLTFISQGPAVGAVLLEWNIHEAGQGSAGLWDSHVQVGGSKGTMLDAGQCLAGAAASDSDCIGAALMVHVTASASAYMENVWLWVADVDIDDADAPMLDVKAGRGILVEGVQGPTWLYALAAAHATLYQAQLVEARNVAVVGLRTTTPPSQPVPPPPGPFVDSYFAQDPDYDTICAKGATCAFAAGLRIVASSGLHIVGAALYSLGNTLEHLHDASCIADLQDTLLSIEQQMPTHVVGIPGLAVAGTKQGRPRAPQQHQRDTPPIVARADGGTFAFTGYKLYTEGEVASLAMPAGCKRSLAATIFCDDLTRDFIKVAYRNSPGNQTTTDTVCAATCISAVQTWVRNVERFCPRLQWPSGLPGAAKGRYIWAGLNETCSVDVATGRYCNDVIADFTVKGNYDQMPRNELCQPCYTGRLRIMQASPYSAFDTTPWYGQAAAYVNSKCAQRIPTTAQPSLATPNPVPAPFCASGLWVNSASGDTCDSLAWAHNVSSASLFSGNNNITICANIPAGQRLCMPPKCNVHTVKDGETCLLIEALNLLEIDSIRANNPWLDRFCSNLQSTRRILGSVICLSPPGGSFTPGTPSNTSVGIPGHGSGHGGTGYYDKVAPVPDGVAGIAPGTAKSLCGAWAVVAPANDTCAAICRRSGITVDMLRRLNPSIPRDVDCTASLQPNVAYCVGEYQASLAEPDSLHFSDTGCWRVPTTALATSPLAVSTAVSLAQNATLSPPDCVKYCASQRFFPNSGNMAALLDGRTCICARHIEPDAERVLDSSFCATPCAGNAQKYPQCGGSSGSSGDGLNWGGNGAGTNIAPGTAVKIYTYGVEEGFRQYLNRGHAPHGCYLDENGQGLASDEKFDLALMRVEDCSAACLPSFHYFGVSGGNVCWCGNGLGQGTRRADNQAECNAPCSGNSTQICGGPQGRLSIFGLSRSPPQQLA
ncbi:pectate lyase superfamily protein-domain-containing protein [Microdochium bolleyi]|uniref:Pectate lyase superfamily protein-domain-containing protein n=1 Tax=Microdochium bolleyi TaxID=196109 RepID=A0A136IIS7_9PEZI|nr:pectate lyase superfamily protein-domain-containing protein [Microdochium bolleyi]